MGLETLVGKLSGLSQRITIFDLLTFLIVVLGLYHPILFIISLFFVIAYVIGVCESFQKSIPVLLCLSGFFCFFKSICNQIEYKGTITFITTIVDISVPFMILFVPVCFITCFICIVMSRNILFAAVMSTPVFMYSIWEGAHIESKKNESNLTFVLEAVKRTFFAILVVCFLVSPIVVVLNSQKIFDLYNDHSALFLHTKIKNK